MIIQSENIKLGDIIDTLKGYAFKSKWYTKQGVPIVKVSNFTDESIDATKLDYVSDEIATEYQQYSLEVDDIIIQTVGSWPTNPNSVVGKVVRVPSKLKNALLNQNAVKIIPRNDVIKRFLFYALKNNSFKDYIVNCAQGAANQASITLESIRSYQLHLPSFDTQQKIASILSAYDDLIENNTRRIKILEEMAQAIYKEWFVNFKFPGYEKTKFVDSALGKIPEGWGVKKLGDILELLYGKALKSEERIEGEYPVYGSSGIIGSHNNYLVEGPGIVVGRKGNVGSVYFTFNNFYPIDTVFYVRTSLPLIYIYYLLKDISFINNDAAVPGLSRSAAFLKEIILPPVKTIKNFSDKVIIIYQQIEKLQLKNQNLGKTRDLLLPKLISGEVSV